MPEPLRRTRRCVVAQRPDTPIDRSAAGRRPALRGSVPPAVAAGAQVIGIAGTPAPCEWVREIGAENCVTCREEGGSGTCPRLCPDGVDAIFDNVGEAIPDHLLPHLAADARMVPCAAIFRYDRGRGLAPAQLASPADQQGPDAAIHRLGPPGPLRRDRSQLPTTTARWRAPQPRAHDRRADRVPSDAPQARRRHKRRQAARAGRTLVNRVHPTATPSRRTPTHQRGVPPCRPY